MYLSLSIHLWSLETEKRRERQSPEEMGEPGLVSGDQSPLPGPARLYCLHSHQASERPPVALSCSVVRGHWLAEIADSR